MIPIRLEPRGGVHYFHVALNLNSLLWGFVFVNMLTAIAYGNAVYITVEYKMENHFLLLKKAYSTHYNMT